MSKLLSVQNVHKSFFGGKVLNGVSLSIPEGSMTGLIGPNGAGKSTLFNVLSGLYSPDSGSIILDGLDITRASASKRVRRGLVRTFQLARGFPKLSVFQHLMLYGQHQPGEQLISTLFGSKAAREREEALRQEAFETADRLRLSRVLDNPITALSGGQKKLVEIGRALMAKPRLILLDEPMAGVNPALTAEIASHLEALNASGMTICLIEHDISLIGRLCDPVIVLAEGRTLVQGSFREVVDDVRVQDAYLGGRHAHA